jgi:G3E family GTPase
MADGRQRRDPLRLVVLGGFLGSGKTTFLRRCFAGPGEPATAFIVNDFGRVGLDHRLIGAGAAPAMLSGGCACCDLREELAEALRALVERRQAGEPLARAVLETSGLADPGAVAATVAEHRMLRHHVVVDRVVVTADAVRGAADLEDRPQARAQAAGADELVVTKADLAAPGAVEALADLLRALNPVAPIHVAVDGEIHPVPLRPAPAGVGAALARRDAAPQACAHRDGIVAHCVTSERPLDWVAFSVWLSMLLHARPRDVLRVKGIVDVEDAGAVAIDAVGHVVHPPRHLDAEPAGGPSELVFITRDIAPGAIERSLAAFSRIGTARRPAPDPPPENT